VIELAIERFDLLGYIRDLGANEEQWGEWVMACPICGKEKLVVNIRKKTWHCWVCQKMVRVQTETGPKLKAEFGAGGVLDLIQLLENCDRKRAVSLLFAGAMLTSKDLDQITHADFYSMLVGPSLQPPHIEAPPNWRHITEPLPYMQHRGISMEDARQFGLFWCDGGRFANRLVFPVFEDHRMVYWQARAMWDVRPGEKKVLNPRAEGASATSGEVLMNLDVAKGYGRVCITEGPIDCVHAGYDAVATFGKRISPVQIAKLVRANIVGVDLMWDGPSPKEPQGAWPDMVNAAQLLAPFFDVRLVKLPYGDPGDWPREHLNQFRAMAQPFRRTSMIASV